jgi:chromosomal replication initiator protein
MADPDARVLGDVLSHLRGHCPAICRQWFEELEPLGAAAGVIRFRASSGVHRDYLQRQCMDQFNDAVRAVTGHLLSVRFLGPEDVVVVEPPPPSPRISPASTPAEPAAPSPTFRRPVIEPKAVVSGRRDALVINPDNTFENFVIGPSNRLAHAAAVAVANNPGRTYNPLFVHGGVGLGKSHLLQAVCLQILGVRPETDLYYLSCEGFMTQFTDCVQQGQMAEFRHTFRDVDVLVIDDIHFLTKRKPSQEEFFHTFNSLYQNGKQIILSSDAPPEEIPELEERLVSRFKQGMVAEVEAAGFETRVSIVKQKALLRGMMIPDDVCSHIASCIDTNIRELEGAITKLQLQSMVQGLPVNLQMARLTIGDARGRTGSETTIHDVISAVTEYFGVRLTDLQSKRRHRSVTIPRQVCMFLARQHTRHSLEEIGGHFGGRDHTTVMHALQAVKDRRDTDPEFRAQLEALDVRVRRAHPVG